MRQLFKAATILKKTGDRSLRTEVADILVDGQTIVAVGPQEDVPAGTVVTDASRYLVTPGFVNTHGHLAMTLLRGVADDVPLNVWLEKYMFPREALMQSDDIYYGSLLALAEGIMSGTTTFTDMYFFEDAAARAVQEAGVRANLCSGVSSMENADAKLHQSEEFARRWNGKADGRIRTSHGPHAPYTVTPEFVRDCFASARSMDIAVQIHLHETHKEIVEFTQRYGASPILYYAEKGYFDDAPRIVAAHCVHMTREDCAVLKRADASIALNIQSNLKLGSGIAPYPLLLDSGVNLSVGTDGAASNDNVDMLEELRTLGLVMKGSTSDASRISNASLLTMATSNGAHALGFDGAGVLAAGAAADLVFWDLEDESFCPGNDVASHLLWAANSRAADSVMVAGAWVMHHRELQHIDLPLVKAEVARRAQRLAGA